ncbi:phosphonate metabolism protein PhnM [Vibrio nigripulchritudo]|uniref:alpha-D-ribose 1-methylphosphonate 5-triphosphate diphosphatase n=1 Tax=Vibrio nigripulchritudo TaxID=28173 RepID=UPI001909E51B|nr:alpha-D-ribose 1-methylphosphonate 5-triphosphate diphosphatase [Vibrio nigripulchritudo]BCL68084.1 phosphonate metabolism protein PhnM [Vibrio nigripulchritudo]BDU29412.1 phosphonate metabolism protein PhnM [Vibrio nigripulchritudo]
MKITNVNIVLPDSVVYGTVEIDNHTIKSVSEGLDRDPNSLNGQGHWLLPGLIELHTDNLEKYFTPRPKVSWPEFSAMAAHDAQLIGSGITTVLDAVAVGDVRDGGTRQDYLDKMIDTLVESERRGVNRAEHFLHIRCELPHFSTYGLAERYLGLPQVKMVSLMDHSPGQRQFVNLQKYYEYYQGKYGLNDAEMQTYEAEQRRLSEQWSNTNRKAIAELCLERGIPMASHDDATNEHVEESHNLGLVLAEFPTTVEAATRSHQLGLHVLMGAPNVVRGGSHSGNVAAHELASMGVLDVLSSDYFPLSLLDSVFKLAEDERNTLDLPAAVKLATANPADALGMHDRGEIREGKRADLILVEQVAGQAYVKRAWCKGQIAY